MRQQKINKYQDAYRKAWEAQNKIDAKINKSAFTLEQIMRPLSEPTTVKKTNDNVNARPVAANTIVMTHRAKVINNMLQHGFTPGSVSGMLELSIDAVKNIIQKYGLPRNE